MTYVPRTKQQRNQLRDNVPELVDGKPVLLDCGCQLMRAPDVSSPTRKWWCTLHHGWQTLKAAG
jgi:hypothetical protein